MKKLYFTQSAEKHLTDIYNFSIKHWGSDRTNLYFLRLEQTLHMLCQQPLIAMRRENLGESVFSFPVDRHIVYFKLSEDSLTIMAIFHQNQLAKKDLLTMSNTKDDLKKRLTAMQYHVTQENGTEPPFQNEFDQHFKEGIYVDIVSGEALFSSTEKFDAGCGWPAFSKPIIEEEITEHQDLSYGYERIEVRSKTANSHLGHVFNDGLKEKGGLRYCINSAALRFISKENLQKEGYEHYLYLFD